MITLCWCCVFALMICVLVLKVGASFEVVAAIGVFSGFVWFLGIVLVVFEFGLVIAIVLCCFCLRCLLVSCGFLSGGLLL